MTQRQAEDEPQIIGVGVEYPDENEVLDKALRAWRKVEKLQERRAAQSITFGNGPVCLVFAADLHLGGQGVNYARVFDEAKIITETPSMYLVLVGDMLDNFVIPKLISARHVSEFPIEDEWTLVKKYLKTVGGKLLVSVGGNHERWSFILDGVDYFRDVLERTIKRAIIYDSDDVRLMLHVGKADIAARIRHQWRYHSMWNVTHGIEQARRFDADFRLGVGAHTHASGVCRGFNAAGQQGMAVLCGSYKEVDPFARQHGFAKPNGSTAQSVILFPNGFMLGVERLDAAADLIRRLKGA